MSGVRPKIAPEQAWGRYRAGVDESRDVDRRRLQRDELLASIVAEDADLLERLAR
ncbi:hypothetical protein Lesp02_75590 [Lentzea sp. NBRC 105346]|uniref:hypothetical protein n=1 Tax=Lentzea sp. NBRC 105346 TaxID=3032205 RepID=UPI0024A4385D|nr:hypothetical protein [Lentzea sp. NBRC 105346]GLZ35372.1 hypothetical protein Lesp02_75590 [Lentzea sp. NBRC 105346]